MSPESSRLDRPARRVLNSSRSRRPARRRVLLAAASRSCSTRSPMAPTSGSKTRSTWSRSTRTRATTFAHLVDRVLRPAALPTGRILLLLGESGSGKTHLMRAFRNRVHSAQPRLLRLHADDRVHQPVRALRSEQPDRIAGQALLRTRIPGHGTDAALDGLARVARRDDSGKTAGPAPRAGSWTSRRSIKSSASWPTGSSSTTGSTTIDLDLVQALLYLQCNDPRIKARVLKYLRCEDLTAHDRQLLGGIVPCTYPDAPHWVIQRLGS